MIWLFIQDIFHVKGLNLFSYCLHYGMRFKVGNLSFDEGDHHNDDIVYDCNCLFHSPPYPKEVRYQREQNIFILWLCFQLNRFLRDWFCIDKEVQPCKHLNTTTLLLCFHSYFHQQWSYFYHYCSTYIELIYFTN